MESCTVYLYFLDFYSCRDRIRTNRIARLEVRKRKGGNYASEEYRTRKPLVLFKQGLLFRVRIISKLVSNYRLKNTFEKLVYDKSECAFCFICPVNIFLHLFVSAVML